MIRLFKNTETDFTHNGVQVLDDIVIGDTCTLSNGINEVYALEMEVAIFDNDKWKDIESEMFLRVPAENGEQIFRIKEVVQGFSTLKIYAKHVFYDLENNFILDTNVVQKDGRSALAQILGGMSNNMINTYYSSSDIALVRNSRLVRKNVVTALLGSDDNSFINRWGGELELNNFNFAINTRIGQDRGFTIRYAKNCTGYEGNVNTYKLCTRIIPVGYDGIMLDGTKWVDSPNITKYPQIYSQEVKFDDIKVKENPDDEEGYNTIEEAREALRQAAVDTFTVSKCDLPSFSARVNFVTLQNTVEYEDIQALERVELGDDVYIYLSNIGVTASSRVVKTKYNFFTKKYIEVEVGEVKPNFFKQLVSIKEAINLVTEQLGGNTWQDIINKSLDEATKLMQEGLKDSYVITMKNQIIIGDDPDINNMVNCIVMNKNGIGFSNNGYLPEQLISAMTIDGKINASCITTGQLNAALIKTGMLMSANGTTWIDMENGTLNFGNGALEWQNDTLSIKGDLSQTDKITNKKSCEIKDNSFIVYDHLTAESDTHEIGRVRAFKTKNKTDSATRNAIALNATNEDLLILGYINKEGAFIETMVFDGTKAYDGISNVSVNGALKAYHIYFQNLSDNFAGDIVGDGNNLRLRTSLDDGGMFVFGEQGSLTDNVMEVRQSGLFHKGNISCGGTKNRIVETSDYGKRALNAYETASCYFGDIGEATTNEDCISAIMLDEILLQTVNISNYHVFLSKYGQGDIWVEERNSNNFIVKSSVPNLKFSWEFKALQKNYEHERLREFK